VHPELLAPAGSFDCAEAAFVRGADAVYAGLGRFNLRAHSPNFEADEFGELLKLAAVGNKRVYAALNIIPGDDMLAPIEETLRRLVDANSLPDAFIVSDPGVLSLVTEICPRAPVHLSTQSGCFNSASMKFWQKQGISRVILPRELCIEQIRSLSRQGVVDTVDTEIFIHGAMCVSVSGRCLLGAYYNGRHPNLGDCPQPYRFKYRLMPVDQAKNHPVDTVDSVDSAGSVNTDLRKRINNQYTDGGFYGFDVEEVGDTAYLLNSKDLCTVGILPELIESGVSSLKIEGRNKTAHYVASTVKVYRDAIDTYMAAPDNYKVKEWWREELDAIDHRPYTTGFYGGDPVKQEVFASKARAGYRLAGVVKAVAGGRPVIDVKNVFSLASSGMINVLPVKKSKPPFDITLGALLNFDGAETQRATPNRLVLIDGCGESLKVGDMLRIKY
jgi:putative protease